MARYDQLEFLDTEASFEKLKVEDLKALIRLLDREIPPRKPEQVAILTRVMRQQDKVRALYDQLDDLCKAAVQEAVHDPKGVLDLGRFTPKYGWAPDLGRPSGGYSRGAKPAKLRLFFPQPYTPVLPTDLRELLLAFVPEPAPMRVDTVDELPTAIPQEKHSWHSGTRVAEVVEHPSPGP